MRTLNTIYLITFIIIGLVGFYIGDYVAGVVGVFGLCMTIWSLGLGSKSTDDWEDDGWFDCKDPDNRF